jgi:hypothetical protein
LFPCCDWHDAFRVRRFGAESICTWASTTATSRKRAFATQARRAVGGLRCHISAGHLPATVERKCRGMAMKRIGDARSRCDESWDFIAQTGAWPARAPFQCASGTLIAGTSRADKTGRLMLPRNVCLPIWGGYVRLSTLCHSGSQSVPVWAVPPRRSLQGAQI